MFSFMIEGMPNKNNPRLPKIVLNNPNAPDAYSAKNELFQILTGYASFDSKFNAEKTLLKKPWSKMEQQTSHF